MSFHTLHLAAPLLAAIQSKGYKKPTPIQQQAIPVILSGNDLIGKAPTGTGKTAAFILPALHKISHSEHREKPQVLVLTPTRELANQITQVIYDYGKEIHIKPISLLGGMPYREQQRKLSRPHDILIATPGRFLDYIRQGTLDLSQIKMLILDEADRMLDMGFIDDVELIASQIPKKRQTLLFTATTDKRLLSLSQNILRSPQFIEVKHDNVTLDNIRQYLYITNDSSHKFKLLQHLLKEENVFKAVIFSGTKHNADRVARDLVQHNFQAGALHGDMNQKKRNRTIADFRSGKIQFLVATDVAARGIDINDITHVFNYDLPKFAEDYVHRIGRTGRAGREGLAISFVSSNDFPALKKIERFTRQTLSHKTIKGLEPHSQPKQQEKNHFSQKSKKPFKKSFKKSFGKPSDKRNFDERAEERHFSKKPKKNFGKKPERNAERNFDGGFNDRAEKRHFGKKKAFGDKPKKSFGRKSERSFEKNSGDYSEKRHFGKKSQSNFGERSDRNFGDKPKKSFGRKSERSGERNFNERAEKRSFGKNPKKKFGDRDFSKKDTKRPFKKNFKKDKK